MIDQPADMLRHMLGLPAFVWIDEPRKPPHRNYAAMTHDEPLFLQMERDGLVERYRRCDNYDWWRTTDKGRAVAFASIEHRKRSRSAAKYARWLALDGCTGHRNFREFLLDKSPDVVRYRESGQYPEGNS